MEKENIKKNINKILSSIEIMKQKTLDLEQSIKYNTYRRKK